MYRRMSLELAKKSTVGTLAVLPTIMRRTFTGIYKGRFHLSKEQMDKAFEVSDRLAAVRKVLRFQDQGQCAGASAEMLANLATVAAARKPPEEGYETWKNSFHIDNEQPIESLNFQPGPPGPADGKTRSKLLAELIAGTLNENGPELAHLRGFGGPDASMEYYPEKGLAVRNREKQREGPYGMHNFMIIGVDDEGCGVFVDSNDRSDHNDIKEFKNKHAGLELGNLPPGLIQSEGLDAAMIYFAPIEETITLSLLEDCGEKLREEAGIKAKTREDTLSDYAEEGFEMTSTKEWIPIVRGIIYSHPKPPLLFKEPDKKLYAYMKELREQGHIVTAEQLQVDIEKTKQAYRDKYGAETFDSLWREVNGVEQSQKRDTGKASAAPGGISPILEASREHSGAGSQTSNITCEPVGISSEDFSPVTDVSRKRASLSSIGGTIRRFPGNAADVVTGSRKEGRFNMAGKEALTPVEVGNLKRQYPTEQIHPGAELVKPEAKVKNMLYSRRADGSLIVDQPSAGGVVKSQIVPKELVPPDLKDAPLRFGQEVAFTARRTNAQEQSSQTAQTSNKPVKKGGRGRSGKNSSDQGV
ncbi:MAG TPA: hypothetical protein VM532_15345 [Burkholderiales bacterium]|nr:hypothetical protein [Burkholderiales bacterium]